MGDYTSLTHSLEHIRVLIDYTISVSLETFYMLRGSSRDFRINKNLLITGMFASDQYYNDDYFIELSLGDTIQGITFLDINNFNSLKCINAMGEILSIHIQSILPVLIYDFHEKKRNV